MKRIIAFIITVLLLSSCIFITASADGLVVSFSEDYDQLYYKGYRYSQFNDKWLEVEDSNYLKNIELASREQNEINLNLRANPQETVLYADIEFIDSGLSLSAAFIREDLLAEYNNIITGNGNEYRICDWYDYDDYISADKSSLLGEKVILYGNDFFDYYYNFTVYTPSRDGSFMVIPGEILVLDGANYYVDYNEVGAASPHEFYPEEENAFIAYKITDETLCAQIEKMYEDKYSDLEFFNDDSFTEKIALIFCVIIFAILPFVIFVLSFIFAIRSRTVYKKFFFTISVLSVSELIVFAIITILMTVFKYQ